MSWQTPKTDWGANDVPTVIDFDRIENNIAYLKFLVS